MPGLSREEKEKLFCRIWLRFNANLGSLRAFAEKMPRVADQGDEEFIRQAAHKIASLFDEDPQAVFDELRPCLLELDSLDIYPNYRENPEHQETFDAFESGDFVIQGFRWAREHPEKEPELKGVMGMFLEPAANGILLRRGALIMLVSFFEILLKDLITAHELLDLPAPVGSLDDAWQFAYRKTDDRIRGLAKLSKKLTELIIEPGEMDTLAIPGGSDALSEIGQRRNILTHNDGIIDQGYLAVLLKSMPDMAQPPKIGDRVLVSDRYLEQALKTIHMTGFALYQLSARSWLGKRIHGRFDDDFEHFMFGLLKREQYQDVIKLSDLIPVLHLDRNHRYHAMINHAIALREMGKFDEMAEIVKVLERKETGIRIQMAVDILRHRNRHAFELLDQALDELANGKKSIGTISRDWPLFKPVWGDSQFERIFQKRRSRKPPK